MLPVVGTPAAAVSAGLLISQVYRGGGNASTTFANDDVELFDRGTTPVRATGLSVQYASGAVDEPYCYGTDGLSANRFRGGDTITGLTGVMQYAFDRGGGPDDGDGEFDDATGPTATFRGVAAPAAAPWRCRSATAS